MGVKRRNKVSAEFNMSSMTDIIFLLLIFFMLTSNLVAPNALNLKLPGRGNPTTATADPTDVTIKRNGNYYLNGKRITLRNVETALRRLKRSDRNLAITISPDDGTPVENVVAIMDIAMRHQINAILATEE